MVKIGGARDGYVFGNLGAQINDRPRRRSMKYTYLTCRLKYIFCACRSSGCFTRIMNSGRRGAPWGRSAPCGASYGRKAHLPSFRRGALDKIIVVDTLERCYFQLLSIFRGIHGWREMVREGPTSWGTCCLSGEGPADLSSSSRHRHRAASSWSSWRSVVKVRGQRRKQRPRGLHAASTCQIGISDRGDLQTNQAILTPGKCRKTGTPARVPGGCTENIQASSSCRIMRHHGKYSMWWSLLNNNLQ